MPTVAQTLPCVISYLHMRGRGWSLEARIALLACHAGATLSEIALPATMLRNEAWFSFYFKQTKCGMLLVSGPCADHAPRLVGSLSRSFAIASMACLCAPSTPPPWPLVAKTMFHPECALFLFHAGWHRL